MPLSNPSVQRVQAALRQAGSSAEVIALAETARSAQEAADSIGCALGAIVKSLVFTVGGQPVMALVAGDRRCNEKTLPAALGLTGKAKRATAEQVREATGYAIGGVSPVGHPAPLLVAIDSSLSRFTAIFAAAGHPHCVFGTTPAELQKLTGGALSDSIGLA
jgi:prolyl-tRNA editing enzyme YbaK/EbsC (Cys-tRNA(Pro) deacylase)